MIGLAFFSTASPVILCCIALRKDSIFLDILQEALKTGRSKTIQIVLEITRTMISFGGIPEVFSLTLVFYLFIQGLFNLYLIL